MPFPGTGITAPVGAPVPIQRTAEVQGPIVPMEIPLQRGAAEHTTDTIRQPEALAIGARAEAPEAINHREDPFQGAVGIAGLRAAQEVREATEAVVALPEARAVSEVPVAVPEVLVAPVGLREDHAQDEVVEDHKFQFHIV